MSLKKFIYSILFYSLHFTTVEIFRTSAHFALTRTDCVYNCGIAKKAVFPQNITQQERNTTEETGRFALLTWRQAMDKVGQLLGRSLVSKENRPMKCTTSKLFTCLVTNRQPILCAAYFMSNFIHKWQKYIIHGTLGMQYTQKFLCCFPVKKYTKIKALASLSCAIFDATIVTLRVTRVMVKGFHRSIVFGN